MPDYLSPAAIDVWQEELGRVMQAGVSEVDSSLFARYCSMEAIVRQAFKEGLIAPPAAVLTMLRQHAEMLGIAGRKSRIGTKPDGKPHNPFAGNGNRSRA